MEEKISSIPYNQLAEQSVLSAMLLNKDAIGDAIRLVSSKDFYHTAHSEIFDAIVELFNVDKPVDIITLTEQLRLRGSFDSIGLEYLVEVANASSTSGNLRHYAKIVTDKAVLRRLIDACSDVCKQCYAGEDETKNLLDLAEQRVFEILENRDNREFTVIGDVISANYSRAAELSASPNDIIGMPTGFTDLDRILKGLHKQNYILIAARPSMGKTSFALNMAVNAARATNEPVAIFSLEMSKEELVNRIWSSETAIESSKIQTGKLEDREWTQLVNGIERIQDLPIYIDDTGGTTITDIRAKTRRLKRDKGLGLIIIDHMQLMKAPGNWGGNRQQEITEISRSLKLLAKDLDVPVVTLAQLNRAAETRSSTGNRPMLSDLRESGAIEQDADVVLMLYREDYYNPQTERPGIAECLITKHRNGELGKVELKWRSQFTKFGNLETRYDDPQ
ncbi:MAG: replicative DNA helicase [Eubacteriales bacterium]|nr:replicative DNA helicase [Eubacteriales bacterium]